MPADPELQRKWLEARKPARRPPDSKSIDEIAAEVMGTTPVELREDASLHIFQRHQGHLVVGMRTIRAHIKDVARVLSMLYVGKIEKEKSFAVKVANAVYYPPELYYVPILNQAGTLLTEPTGRRDKAIHVMTAMGPRSALKTMEYVTDAVLEFPLTLLTQPDRTVEGRVVPGKMVVSEADLRTIFTYGGTHGYGPERSDGEGRYAFSVTQKEG